MRKHNEIKTEVINVRLTFLTEVLGTAPSDEEIYRNYVASKSENATKIEEEVASLGVDEVTDRGTTTFLKDQFGNYCLHDHMIKGFFKEVCGALRKTDGTLSSKATAYKTEINGNVFVYPEYIPFENAEIGRCERALRAATPQGEKTALASSETVREDSSITFRIEILPTNKINSDTVIEWLWYGWRKGLGQWRTGGKGRFYYEELDDEGNVIDTNKDEVLDIVKKDIARSKAVAKTNHGLGMML